MSGREQIPESEKKRNVLTVRWNDKEHSLITDEAWRRRISCAAMIRQLVNERLGIQSEDGRPS